MNNDGNGDPTSSRPPSPWELPLVTEKDWLNPETWQVPAFATGKLRWLVRNGHDLVSKRKLMLYAAVPVHALADYAASYMPELARCLELAHQLAEGRSWCDECDRLSEQIDRNRSDTSAAVRFMDMGKTDWFEELETRAGEALDTAWNRLLAREIEDQPPSNEARLHDIFGNPFRPVTFLPSWRTDTAIALARTMYDSREFGAMPILADALQDAGCDNTDILTHCRDPKQTHVRGCWVVDLVLGKG
jgi:hypothetical protein